MLMAPSASTHALPKRLVSFRPDIKQLSIGAFKLANLVVSESKREFEDFEAQLFSELRGEMTLDGMKDHVILRSFRDLYWTFGMDPTKLRVSSEALLRRVLGGQNLWRVSDVVDVANLMSAYHKLPIGLVDLEKIDGGLVVRTARNGEVFRRIGGSEVVCRGREIVVGDKSRIVCFGFATLDSDYTKVTKQSRNVLLMIYGAPSVKPDVMESALELTSGAVKRWLNCDVGPRRVYTSQGSEERPIG